MAQNQAYQFCLGTKTGVVSLVVLSPNLGAISALLTCLNLTLFERLKERSCNLVLLKPLRGNIPQDLFGI